MPASATRSGPGRTTALALTVAGAALTAVTLPQAASAAVVSESAGVVTYQAAPGETNLTIPSVVNGRIRLQETAAATPLSAGLGCTIVSLRVAECAGGSRLQINLGDGNDVYYGTGAGFTPATINAGAGDDILFDGAGALRREIYSGGTGQDTVSYFLESAAVSLSLDGRANDGQAGEGDTIATDVENLTGGPRADVLVGSAAGNVLRGEGGNDRLTGLGGDDFFEEGASANGADVFAGGPGFDRVRYGERASAGVRVTLDGADDDGQAGESDNAQPDVEVIQGTRFADTLIGSELNNTIAGLGGNDRINALGGNDVVTGDDGNDTINARDGVRDTLSGGAGSDTIDRDTIDNLIG